MNSQKKFINNCIEWDVVNWSKSLDFWESKASLKDGNLSCLELGGRAGGLSLWLASKGNHVICSDYVNPQSEAQALHRNYAFADRIEYQSIDATRIPFQNHFDIIVFKSILGGISRNGQNHLKRQTIHEIYKALKPGGRLLFAENLVGSKVHQFIRRKAVTWSYWNYLNLNELAGLFRDFASLEYGTAGFLGLLGRTESQRRLLGYADTFLFEKLVGQRMRYIVYGVATKGTA